MPDKDDLDRLLDSALASYADPGADSGLEQRVLAGLSMARDPGEHQGLFEVHRRRWLPIAAALSMAAGVLLVWLTLHKNEVGPKSEPQKAQTKRPLSIPAIPQVSPTIHPAQRHRRSVLRVTLPPQQLAANAIPLPKRDVFPTPQPMTPQERALATVAAPTVPPVREAMAARALDTSPLDVAAIHVPPLEPPDETQR
jgi:hypothetical protein